MTAPLGLEAHPGFRGTPPSGQACPLLGRRLGHSLPLKPDSRLSSVSLLRPAQGPEGIPCPPLPGRLLRELAEAPDPAQGLVGETYWSGCRVGEGEEDPADPQTRSLGTEGCGRAAVTQGVLSGVGRTERRIPNRAHTKHSFWSRDQVLMEEKAPELAFEHDEYEDLSLHMDLVL